MKKYMLVLAFIALTIQASFADVTPESISDAIDIHKLEHPYLFFSRGDIPSMLNLIENESVYRYIFRRLEAEANRYMFAPVERYVPGEEDDFYTGRLRYLRAQRSAVETLSFLYQLTGDKRYADKAFEYADTICDVPDWVNGYHQFPVIYTMVWPWNVPDDQVSFGVDLEAAHTAFTLALAYDWLYDALDKPRRDRIRGALLEKVITRVRGNYEYHWWASSYRCNWCSVCNSYIGCAALSILTEDPNLVDVAAESYNRIVRTLDEVGEDGGWQEGCGYWNYMLRTSIEFGDAMKRLTGGKYNLFDHPNIKNNTVNFALYNLIPPDMTVNFGDSGKTRVGQTYFYNKLAKETGSREAAWYRANLFGDGNSIFDIIWPESGVKPGLPDRTSIHFRTIDCTVMRSDFADPETVTIAVRAGLHDDPHHGHLDSGNFILYWRGEGFVSEMGRGSYDERYFQETRWEYPQATSEGHNVVLVNGENQIPAKHKDEPWQEGIGAKILDFRTNSRRDYTLLDATEAYPGRELKRWRRHVILDKPLITVIFDEVAAAPGKEIAVRFHSETNQVVADRHLLLDGDKGDMILVPATEHGFEFRPDKHPVMAASGLTIERASFRWEPFCDVIVKAGDETTVIATVILPSESPVDTEKVVQSATLDRDSRGACILSFEFRGDTHRYVFHPENGGYMFGE